MKIKQRLILLLSIILVLTMPVLLHAENIPAIRIPTDYMTFFHSPRADAMGGCAMTLVDLNAALVNPASLGILHLDKYFVCELPNKTNYFESTNFLSYAISGGYAFNLAPKDSLYDRKLSLSAAYHHNKLETDWIEFTSTGGSDTFVARFIDKLKAYSVAVGYESGVKLGFGFSYKEYCTNLKHDDGPVDEIGKWNTANYSAACQLPHTVSLSKKSDSSLSKKVTLDIMPSLAAMFSYGTGSTIGFEKSPNTKRFGLSLHSGIKINDRTIISITPAFEFLKYDYKEYYSYPDAQFISRHGSEDWIYKYGAEIGALDAFYFRIGKWQKEIDGSGTIGFGISFGDLTRLLFDRYKVNPDNDILRYLVNNMDITYDYADGYGWWNYKTNYFRLGISF